MRISLFYLAIFALCSIQACKKQSCISGTVLDANTGLPIPDATVILVQQYSGSSATLTSHLSTDSTGSFYYMADDKTENGISIKGISKHGYAATNAAEIREEDDCRETTVRLEPLEGRLVLTLTNESGTTDPVYVQLFNQCQELSGVFDGISTTDPYPLLLQPGESRVDTLLRCLADSSSIRWKFAENAPWAGTNAFFAETTDPVSFHLKY